MEMEHYNNEKTLIKNLAIRNGYKSSMIDKILNNMKNKNTLNPINRNKQEYICLPYNKIINKAMRKTFDNTNIKISYRTKNNTFKLIQKMTEQKQQNTNIYDKSGIYKLKCSECPKFYIGQTGRTFKCRYREHIQSIKSNNKTTQKSTFAEHILETQHSYKNISENMEILNIANKGRRMNILEEYNIYINKKHNPEDILNIMQIEKQNPIFDKIEEIKNKII